MKIDRDPYRDEDCVMRCQHGNKLHLACDECQMVERASKTVDELIWWAKLGVMLSAIGLGWVAVMQYNGLLF